MPLDAELKVLRGAMPASCRYSRRMAGGIIRLMVEKRTRWSMQCVRVKRRVSHASRISDRLVDAVCQSKAPCQPCIENQRQTAV